MVNVARATCAILMPKSAVSTVLMLKAAVKQAYYAIPILIWARKQGGAALLATAVIVITTVAAAFTVTKRLPAAYPLVHVVLRNGLWTASPAIVLMAFVVTRSARPPAWLAICKILWAPAPK